MAVRKGAMRAIALPTRRRWGGWAWVRRVWLLTGSQAGTGTHGGATSVEHADAAAEAAAFEAFFKAHQQAIFGYLWRMTGDEQSAYDLSQETFLRAWQHFPRIRAYERPEAWLFRVATNLAITYARRHRDPIANATTLPDESGPALSDPAWHIGERETVRTVLESLPARQRAALLLREVYGLSGEELATALGISLAAAKMLLSRGRETFRVAYVRDEEQGGRA